MAFKIKKDDIKRFRADYDNRRDSHVIENAVTKNGVRKLQLARHPGQRSPLLNRPEDRGCC